MKLALTPQEKGMFESFALVPAEDELSDGSTQLLHLQG